MRPTRKPSDSKGRPSAKTSRRADEDSTRPIPRKRTPEYEKTESRSVNEDAQQTVVNNREENAQSREESFRETDARPAENSNERPEAADDNSEVNPRTRKVT